MGPAIHAIAKQNTAAIPVNRGTINLSPDLTVRAARIEQLCRNTLGV